MSRAPVPVAVVEALALGIALALVGACNEGGIPGGDGSTSLDAATDAAADAGTPDGGSDGGGIDLGLDAWLPPVTFIIEFDYRYDTAGYFNAAERRQALEGAARIWGRLIRDDFPTVPAGTALKTRDPEHPSNPPVAVTRSTDILDVVVFVGSAVMDGPSGTMARSFPTLGIADVTDPTLQAALDVRTHGADFQPWTGWISFDSEESFFFDATPDVPRMVPYNQMDFVTVATHELGHILGFGTCDAFTAHVSGQTFTGAHAVALYGGPVPLSGDFGHLPNATLYNGKRVLMDVSDPDGVRQVPTPLDLAMLADIGYLF